MPTPSSKTVQFILHAIIPVVCSIIVGFILCGMDIFNPNYHTSQFIHTPIIASVFHFLLVLGKPKYAWAGLFVLLVLTIFMVHSTTAILISRDLFYIAAITIAVLLYFKYFKQSAHINFFYTAVTLAGLYSAAYIITSEIHFVILRSTGCITGNEATMGIATLPAFYGVAIGFAVGFGITIADKFLGTLNAGPTK